MGRCDPAPAAATPRAARGIAEKARTRTVRPSVVHSAVDGEKRHLEFCRRLANLSRHVATENHGHDDSRVFAHLSQDQLAARAGIHRDCLRTWERPTLCQGRNIGRYAA